MMQRQTMWVDVARCTGCGACVGVCPVGAMTLVAGKARIDEEACAGCGICVDACPEGAVQPVVQGELVPVPERPAPAVRQPGPLAETAGAAGVGLLTRAGRALARAVGRRLTQPSTGIDLPAARTASTARGGGVGGQGRRARHRRRGS